MEPPIIETERLTLRIPLTSDVPAMVAYLDRESDFLKPYEPLRPATFRTEAFWHERVELNLSEFRNDQALRLAIFLKSDAYIIGTANFTAFTRGPAQNCQLGYGLSEHQQGKGLMTEALRAAIPYVFDALNMHRIMANYMPHNRRSGQLLRRLGFQVEGYARDYLRIDDRWEDHVLTSLTNAEWRKESVE